MTNAIVPKQSAALLDYSKREVLEALKATVAKGATDAELVMFTEHCRATGLNPFKKEVWFIKTQAGVQIMTGLNGFLAIANSHPQFDGMEVEVERNEQGHPVRAIAKVHRKDRKYPTVEEAVWSEDSQPTKSKNGYPTIWGKMPSTMLKKVAKSRALREAFEQELGGLYTAEEMPAEYGPDAEQRVVVHDSVPDKTVVQQRPAKLEKTTIQERPADPHYYVLDNIDPDRVQDAIDLLEARGAVFSSDFDAYISVLPIRKMARYEITVSEAKKRAAKAQVTEAPAGLEDTADWLDADDDMKTEAA